MPISLSIYPDLNLTVGKYTGHIENREFIDFYSQLYSRKDVPVDFNELVDLRSVTNLEVNLDSFRQVSEMTREFYGSTTTRTAILADQDMNSVLADLYDAVSAVDEVEQVAIFKGPLLALRWLGVSRSRIEQFEDIF